MNQPEMSSRNTSSANGKRKRRFTIRRLMLLTLLIAISLGWFRAVGDRYRARQDAYRLETGLRTLEQTIKPLLEKPKQHERNRGRGFLSGMNLDGCDLSGISLTTGSRAFQGASLQGAKLNHSRISCGGSSFQHVNFNHADLTGAMLTAPGSSFQIVTFIGANLVDAKLVGGNGAAFQACSFRQANLTNATIVCSGISAFSAVDIDSTNFDGADLRAIEPDNLRNAYFSDPPTYSSRTKFSSKFDPQEAGWKRQEVPSD